MHPACGSLLRHAGERCNQPAARRGALQPACGTPGSAAASLRHAGERCSQAAARWGALQPGRGTPGSAAASLRHAGERCSQAAARRGALQPTCGTPGSAAASLRHAGERCSQPAARRGALQPTCGTPGIAAASLRHAGERCSQPAARRGALQPGRGTPGSAAASLRHAGERCSQPAARWGALQPACGTPGSACSQPAGTRERLQLVATAASLGACSQPRLAGSAAASLRTAGSGARPANLMARRELAISPGDQAGSAQPAARQRRCTGRWAAARRGALQPACGTPGSAAASLRHAGERCSQAAARRGAAHFAWLLLLDTLVALRVRRDEQGPRVQAADDLLNISANPNTLNVVLRKKKVMRFVKYVNAAAPGSRWDVSLEFKVQEEEEEEDEEGDEGDEEDGDTYACQDGVKEEGE
ncbi:hypothetical protein CYMTET_33216 [Cymbomonas tetramitiformis]|uniref:Oxoglutarate/iron-dependent oxygenase C-terminal degradation domain-containing protein n=1 Tax=Cymbomonas tetramitiformis TaxID=36881 RepID=A0AAE0FDJ6_9CHLO|nr:hypothetical protein CYMTET_33216 [Cymbomonas tetramitiformis]